jgi:hypothetical protein
MMFSQTPNLEPSEAENHRIGERQNLIETAARCRELRAKSSDIFGKKVAQGE